MLCMPEFDLTWLGLAWLSTAANLRLRAVCIAACIAAYIAAYIAANCDAPKKLK